MRNIFKYFSCSIFFIAVVSCGTGHRDSPNLSSEFRLKEDPQNSKIHYKLPSPVELFHLMKSYGAVYRSSVMNEIALADNYITSAEKAVNFGIYAADMSYATVFEIHEKSHAYFSLLKRIANQLGITEGYDKEIVDRLNNNYQNSDSLLQITKDSYWEACNFLQTSEKEDMLSKILLGGWVESVYIAVNSVDSFVENDEVIILISEQRFLLDNLISYLESLKERNTSDIYLERLYELQKSFDGLHYNPEGTYMTNAQFKNIASKVNQFRKELIR